MKPTQLCALLAVCSVATAQLVTRGALFRPLSTGSLTAPVQVESVPGLTASHCLFLCAARSYCFGVYWVQGLCNIFNTSAFNMRNSWQNSSQTDVIIRNFNTFNQSKLLITTCSQLTNYPNSYHTVPSVACNLAIDGNTAQNYFAGSCSSTDSGLGQWWEGVLSGLSFVSFVTIYNRQDALPERLNQFSLLVDGVECYRANFAVPFSVGNFSCMSYGSKVRVVILSNTLLTICELQAYGHTP